MELQVLEVKRVSELQATIEVLKTTGKMVEGVCEINKLMKKYLDSLNLPPPDEETLNEINRIKEEIELSLEKSRLQYEENKLKIKEGYNAEMKRRQILKECEEEKITHYFKNIYIFSSFSRRKNNFNILVHIYHHLS